MESRTRFAIGGMSTVVASIAVVCAVAMTNSVALADSAGVAIRTDPLLVPSSASATALAPLPMPTPKASSAAVETAPQEAVTVPAPAPIVVNETPAAAQAPELTADQALADAETTGDWQSLREWAGRVGWPQERVDAWIHKLEQKRADWQARAENSQKTSADADTSAERQTDWSDFGLKKDRSRDSPVRRDR